MNWTVFDYGVALGLLALAGTALWCMLRAAPDAAYRAGSIVAVLTAVVLVWSNGAVGLIGDGSSTSSQLLYVIPFIVAVIAAVTRLNAKGLSQAAATASLIHLAIMVYAVTQGEDPFEVGFMTALFVSAWVFASVCFRRSAKI